MTGDGITGGVTVGAAGAGVGTIGTAGVAGVNPEPDVLGAVTGRAGADGTAGRFRGGGVAPGVSGCVESCAWALRFKVRRSVRVTARRRETRVIGSGGSVPQETHRKKPTEK